MNLAAGRRATTRAVRLHVARRAETSASRVAPRDAWRGTFADTVSRGREERLTDMESKKPGPLYPVSHGPMCPVCGKRSYSANGIHPQCAVKLADAPRQKLLADEKRERARQLALHAES